MKQRAASARNGSAPEVVDYAFVRSVAVSAGDMSMMVRQEVKTALKKNRNNVLLTLNSGLDELATRDLISVGERDSLKGVCKHLIYATSGKSDAEDAFLAIRKVYHQMLGNPGASPTALAIASVCTSAFNLQKNSPITIIPETTGAGAAVGAVIGGVIGGIVGGGLGAGLGAAIGGAAGAAIGWCNENGV